MDKHALQTNAPDLTCQTKPMGREMEDQDLRSMVYQWLGGLFATELSANMIEHYYSPYGRAFLDLLDEQEALSDFADTFRQQLATAESSHNLAMQLAGSFAHLFLGAGGRRSAPPYQSVYLGDGARLYQSSTSQMEAILRELEMAQPGAFREPADHIAIQLNVMAHLVGIGDRSQQVQFLENHLLSWVPAFASACRMHDRQGLYAALATALSNWPEADQAALQESKAESED